MTERPTNSLVLSVAAGGGVATVEAPQLWHAPADPMFSLVIDGHGGRLLFALDEAEAGAVLMAWWRHHRARLLVHQTAQRRRAMLARVPGADSD